MKTIKLFFYIISASLSLILLSCNSDACTDSLCLNDGVCIDGICACPDRYTGANCSEQKTPDKIEIRTIKITRFPDSNEGTAWDMSDGPDLYFRLFEGENALAQPIIAVNNADNNNEYYFFIDPVYMQNVMNEHTLQLRDYDAEDTDEIMGEVKFIPYNSENGFPSIMTYDDGRSVAFTVELDYIYNRD